MSYKSCRIFVLYLVLLADISSCHSSRSNNGYEYFTVVKVIDGDTFWIDDGSENGRKIRLIGVDAPETRRTSRKQVGYFAQESKKFLGAMLLRKRIRMEYDVDRTDRYGRTLAYVYLEDGTFVNAELLKRGYAMVLTVPPNVRFVDEFVKFQALARNSGRGLWSK